MIKFIANEAELEAEAQYRACLRRMGGGFQVSDELPLHDMFDAYGSEEVETEPSNIYWDAIQAVVSR